jgi:hypothetical protein
MVGAVGIEKGTLMTEGAPAATIFDQRLTNDTLQPNKNKRDRTPR